MVHRVAQAVSGDLPGENIFCVRAQQHDHAGTLVLAMATAMETASGSDDKEEAAGVFGDTNTYLQLSQKLAALSCTGQLNVKRPGAVNANWLRTEGLSTPTLVKSDSWKEAPQMGVTLTDDLFMRYPHITIDLMLDLLLRTRRGLRLEVDTWDAVRQEPGPRWTLLQWQTYWRGHAAARQHPEAHQQDLSQQHARWLADQSRLGLMEAAGKKGAGAGAGGSQQATEAAQQRWLEGNGPVKAASAMDVGVRAQLLAAQAQEQGMKQEEAANLIDEAAAADVAAAWAEVAEDADNDYVFRR